MYVSISCFLTTAFVLYAVYAVLYEGTGWGKITSLNFKVNNKKPIRDTKILFLDSETTTWEGLNLIVLKRISCK